MFTEKLSHNVEIIGCKKSKLAVALALFAIPLSAMAANNVELYGIVDIGALYQTKANVTGQSKTSIETSGMRQSILGFKGEKDLKDQMTAFFDLEAHFDVNNGMFHGTGDAADTGSPLFRRQSLLGLKGNWGSVTVGRQYGPALLAHLATEPRAFKEQFSNLYAWAYNQYAATANKSPGARNTNNDVGIFFNNAIQYRNTVGPVEFGIMTAVGGQAGSTTNNNAMALGIAYKGPVVLSGSYQTIKDEATGNSNVKHSGLGLAVPYNDLTFKANYLNAKNSAPTGLNVSNVNGIGTGVDWKWNASNSFTLAYYDNKDDMNKTDHTRNVVISNDYAMGSNVTLYAQMAIVKADKGATIKTSIVAGGTGLTGKENTNTLLNVGVNYPF